MNFDVTDITTIVDKCRLHFITNITIWTFRQEDRDDLAVIFGKPLAVAIVNKVDPDQSKFGFFF
jgi:hypothetical protein